MKEYKIEIQNEKAYCNLGYTYEKKTFLMAFPLFEF